MSCLLIAESTSDLWLFDEVLVVIERLIKLELLHVFAILNFKIFWDCRLSSTLLILRRYDVFSVIRPILILRDWRSTCFIWSLVIHPSLHNILVHARLTVLIVYHSGLTCSLRYASLNCVQIEGSHLSICDHRGCYIGTTYGYPLAWFCSVIQIVWKTQPKVTTLGDLLVCSLWFLAKLEHLTDVCPSWTNTHHLISTPSNFMIWSDTMLHC